MKSTKMLMKNKSLKTKAKYQLCKAYLKHMKNKRRRAAVKLKKAEKRFRNSTEDTLKLMVAIDMLVKEG